MEEDRPFLYLKRNKGKNSLLAEIKKGWGKKISPKYMNPNFLEILGI